MNSEFGRFFRQLREKRKLTRNALAESAGIAVRTLGYWESGERLPRLPELEAALDVLNADAIDRIALMSQIGPPRGRQQLRSMIAQSDSPAGDIWSETGDLLRAMRLRQGLTQEQVATQLRMARYTVARWENGQTLPSEENLTRACALLKAYPAERDALVSGQLPALLVRPETSLDAGAQAAEQFTNLVLNTRSPLVDLTALALKRHLRLQCERTRSVLPLLAQVEQMHSLWLSIHRRQSEAQESLNRVLQIMENATRPEPFWDVALNLATNLAVIKAQSYHGAERVTRKWLRHLPEGYLRMARLCDMAIYSHKTERTWEYIAEAKECRVTRPDERDKAEAYLELTRTQVEMMNGDPNALHRLLRAAPSTFHRQDYLLGWAQTLARFGEREAARRTLAEMESLIAPEQLAARRQAYLSLWRNLEGAEDAD